MARLTLYYAGLNKRWEDREVPAPVELITELQKHTRRQNCQFVFPSPTGNREQHMLDRCKAVAKRAGLDPVKFDLKTFRSTYATRMLRQGFDVRTVQHWMGHKSLETTMRYLVPASDVHIKLDQVKIPGLPSNDVPPRKSPRRESGSRYRRSREAGPGENPRTTQRWCDAEVPRARNGSIAKRTACKVTFGGSVKCHGRALGRLEFLLP